MENKKTNTYKIVLIALFMALTVVMTMLFRIPIPFGYVNLGDATLLLGGLALGGNAGFLIGGIGSALADLLLGYASYAPITLVVKGLEGFLCGWLFKKMRHKKPLIATVIPGIWMAIGYFIGDTILFGVGAAIGTFPLNLAQGLVGAGLSVLLYKMLKPTLDKRFSKQ